MRPIAPFLLVLLAAPALASAHALDEYVQSTLLNVDANHVTGELKLVPGTQVWPVVLKVIDTSGDGRLDGVEMQGYARTVLGDLSLRIDGAEAPLELVSIEFAPLESFQEGLGEIRVSFGAALPGGAPRKLVYENRHGIATAAYLANILRPADPTLSITSQQRSTDQSRFEVEFASTTRRTMLLPLGLAAVLALAVIVWAARKFSSLRPKP